MCSTTTSCGLCPRGFDIVTVTVSVGGQVGSERVTLTDPTVNMNNDGCQWRGDVCFWASVMGWKSIIRLWFYSLSQSSGAV